MRKRKADKCSEFEQSTVLSKPDSDRKATKPRKKGRIIAWILTILVVVFVVIPWAIVQIANIANSDPKPTFDQRLKNVTVYENAAEVYKLKAADGMDKEAIRAIVEKFEVADYCGQFELKAEKVNDEVVITFVFQEAHDSSRDEWFKMQMIRYSCALCALVDNVQKVSWEYPGSANGANGGFFTRGDADKFLGYSAMLYGATDKGVQLLLSDLGLEG